MTTANRRRETDAVLLLCFCVIAVIFSLDQLSIDQLYQSSSSSSSSSSLELLQYLETETPFHRRLATSIYSWATKHIEPINKTFDPTKETVLFWHIPKSAGTTHHKTLPVHESNAGHQDRRAARVRSPRRRGTRRIPPVGQNRTRLRQRRRDQQKRNTPRAGAGTGPLRSGRCHLHE